MKKSFLIITCFLITVFATAQTPVFEWAKDMGGSKLVNCGNSIALDGSGNIYTTGYFQGTDDFDPGTGTYNLITNGVFSDMFISKLDSAGNFVWAKQMWKFVSSDIEGASIVADAAGNVYTTGKLQGTADFDPSTTSYLYLTSGASGSNEDAFISKLDASGNFVWAKLIGGTSNNYGTSVTIDPQGNTYVTGYFQGTTDFDPGTGVYNLTADSAIYSDMFILKLDASGNFVWAKNIGGTSNVVANSIALDPSGNVYTTGWFQGTADFDPDTTAVASLNCSGNRQIFILKIDGSGNFVWAKSMGGTAFNAGNSIVIDGSGNVLTTGYFDGTTDFDPGVGTYNLSSLSSGNNVFVSKLDVSGNFIWAKNMGGISTIQDFGNSIAVDTSGNVYTTGTFAATADFDPGPGMANLTSGGYKNIFISELDASGNYVWAGGLLGAAIDVDAGYSITVDKTGSIFTTGQYNGTVDFDPGVGVFDISSSVDGGGNDIFIQKMSKGSTSTSGINELTNNNTITIYPNPTNGIFNLKMKGSGNQKIKELKVYNLLSECVYQLSDEQTGTSADLQIDLSNQSNGIYFVKVMNNDRVIATQKIIKQ